MEPPLRVVDGHPLVAMLRTAVQREGGETYAPLRRDGVRVPASTRLLPLQHEAARMLQEELQAFRAPAHICVRRYEDDGHVVFDRCHVDRSRIDGRPMRRTVICFLDDDVRSATCFPYWRTSVAGRPGRLLSFASTERSAHFGVRQRPGTRTVALIGWDGLHFDTGGHHEMLEQADVETRATFFGRTVVEELGGWIGGPRQGEALARLREIAARRHTTIEQLVRDEGRDAAYERRPCILPTPTRRVAPAPLPPTSKPSTVFETDACPVCQDDDVDLLVLACGHQICAVCRDQMLDRPQLCDAAGRLKCPVCRRPSADAWPTDLSC